MRRHNLVRSIIVAVLTVVAPYIASAQSGSAIHLIVGTPAGGAIDAYTRVVGDRMSALLKRPVIVENKIGAGGNISARGVVEAPADGTQIWIGTMAMTEINPSVHKNPGWKINDFIPLIKGVEAPLVFATNPSVPAKTLAEFVAWAKTQSGKLTYSSYTAGSPSHFLGEQMNRRFGLDMTHVSYRGSGPQANDLLAGHALLGFTQVQSVIEFVKAGKINAIATTGKHRASDLPDVPTFAELGYPEFTATIWFGMLVKAGTPPAILDPLMAAIIAAHTDPEVKSKLEAQGFEVSGMTGGPFADEITAGNKRWAELVKVTGFSAD